MELQNHLKRFRPAYCIASWICYLLMVSLILLVFCREGNSPDHHLTISYNQLLRNVCRCANALKLLGKSIALLWLWFVLRFSSNISAFSLILWVLMFVSVIQVWRRGTELPSTYPWSQSWCTRCWPALESGLFTL